MVAELQKIQNTKEFFFKELFFPIREKSFEPVRRITERIEIGILKEEANKMAIRLRLAVLKDTAPHKGIATDTRNGYSSEVT